MILVGSVVSMFAYVSGMMLNVPRMLFAFARDGFLPAAVARVHPAWRTPYVAIVHQAIVVAVLALFAKFEVLAVAANATGLVVYAVCCLAAGELRRRDVRAGGVPFEVPGGAIVPWLAVAVIGWLLWGLKREEWIAAGLVALTAMVLYAVTAAARRKRVAEAV
jgi:amino acid transporter